MSHRAALNSTIRTEHDCYLKKRGVTLLGGRLDEAPQAYKPMEQVIGAQGDLVNIVGKFIPIMVRMTDEAGYD